MVSKTTKDLIDGPPQRKLESWIESFVEIGGNLETPEIFRRWAAITTLGAALEQRVFLLTSKQLFPNLYTMLVGPPGVGKSIAISSAASLVRKLDGFHVGPISVTAASLIDGLAAAKRVIHNGGEHLHFNSLLIMPDDLQALLHKYDQELVGALTIFYDNLPYLQTRRVGAVRVEIASPQLSILAGTTNSHLLNLLPAGAWEQGFMSRTIMIHSPDRPLSDDLFALTSHANTEDLAHDLKAIFALSGQLAYTDGFKLALNNWRKSGQLPAPTHPRLTHYCSRRVVHLLKLAIISCVDRGNSLKLDVFDLDRAKRWLFEAESTMPDVFSGAGSSDAVAMREIIHMIGREPIPEPRLMRLIADRMNVNMVKRTFEILLETKMIEPCGARSNGRGTVRYFKAAGEGAGESKADTSHGLDKPSPGDSPSPLN